MIVFCIVGTEGETGGDGAREVSTGVESESVVRRRRDVVTRRLGVDSYWRRHLMRVDTVLNEYYSGTTPRLVHVCDSFFLF